MPKYLATSRCFYHIELERLTGQCIGVSAGISILVQARKLFTHDNLLAPSLLELVIAMTKGRPTATSTAPMIHRNKVADKILASDIVIPALMRNMFSPTLNSSWPIIILTRLFRYMIRAVSANVSTNVILVMPAQLDRAS